MSDDNVLTGYIERQALAKQLSLTERTLERWARKRIGPPVTHVSRKPLYAVESIRAWLRSNERPMVRARGRDGGEAA